MSVEALAIQADRVFDPNQPGASLDTLKAQLPVDAPWLRGNIVGDILSKRRGSGYDVDGVRPYVPGDDPRYIDQNVTARQPDQWPQVREHYADVNPSLWVVTDSLQTRHRANPGYFSEQNLALSAAMAFMRIGQLEGMPTAAIATNDTQTMQQRQPTQGKPHLLKTAHYLVGALDVAPVSEHKPSLAQLLNYAAERCVEDVVVVVSDFRDVVDANNSDEGWKPAFDKLAKRGNNLIAVETTNPWDFRLPKTASRLRINGGVAWVRGGKAGEEQRGGYAVAAQAQQIAIDAAIKKAGAYHIKLAADNPYWVSSLRDQIRAKA